MTTYNQTTNHTAARWEAQPHHTSRSQMRERRLMEKTEREKSAHKRAVRFACMHKLDEKDKIFNLRPLKKIESVDGRTILYEPSSPKDIAL